MKAQEIYSTLHDFLVEWLTNTGFRDAYDGDLEDALEEHGFDDVDPETLLACLPLVAEDLPLSYQQAIYEYMNTTTVDSGSDFAVNQGGGGPTGTQGGGVGGGHGAGGGHHAAEAAAAESHHGDEPIDEVIRHIYNIQNVTENNYSYIDDSGDVTTTVSSLGDVWLDQVVATGGGVAAGDDIEGAVNTGINNGIIAGDDVEDAEVTNVTGDGNVTGEVTDSTVVTGDDNVLAKDSNVIDGDFDGGFVGGDVDADQSAINFGDGKIAQDNSVDNSTHLKVDDSFNDESDHSINDSGNTDNSVNDSFKVRDSFNDQSDHSIEDSGNTEIEVEVEDVLNTYEDNDTKLRVDESFNDESDHSIEDSGNTDIEVDDVILH